MSPILRNSNTQTEMYKAGGFGRAEQPRIQRMIVLQKGLGAGLPGRLSVSLHVVNLRGRGLRRVPSRETPKEDELRSPETQAHAR